ncbi:MAG: tetratricopeptide repeat protein [Xanthomonadales bacterium]|nr:tetratricopeptide repeat protein [Xanthomonadales bacterium]
MRETARAHLDRADALTGPDDVAIRGLIAVRRLVSASVAGEMQEVESQSAVLLAQIDAGDSTLSLADRADVLITRANALNFLGRGGESLVLLQRVLALLPQGPELARKRLSAHSQLGQNLQNLGRLQEAESHLREALRVSLANGFDPLRVSRDRNNLAGVLAMQGRFAEAMAEHRLGIADFIAVAGREHPEYGVRLNNLGMTEYGAGDIDHSLQHMRESVALNRERYGPQSHIVAVAEANLAGVLTAAGRFAGSAVADRCGACEPARQVRVEQPAGAACRARGRGAGDGTAGLRSRAALVRGLRADRARSAARSQSGDDALPGRTRGTGTLRRRHRCRVDAHGTGRGTGGEARPAPLRTRHGDAGCGATRVRRGRSRVAGAATRRGVGRSVGRALAARLARPVARRWRNPL